MDTLIFWLLLLGAINAALCSGLLYVRLKEQRAFHETAQRRLNVMLGFPEFRTQQRTLYRDLEDRLNRVGRSRADLLRDFEVQRASFAKLHDSVTVDLAEQRRAWTALENRAAYQLKELAEVKTELHSHTERIGVLELMRRIETARSAGEEVEVPVDPKEPTT